MKKIIVALSCMLLAAIVLIRVANSQVPQQETKKAATETKMNCGKSSAACASMSDMKACCKKSGDAAKCDTSKCKMKGSEMKCQMKNCDPAKCGATSKK
jgi:hypothetical protein